MNGEDNFEQALKAARTEGTAFCPTCNDDYFSPMDKLSIALYGECPVHLEDDGHKETNLLRLSENL